MIKKDDPTFRSERITRHSSSRLTGYPSQRLLCAMSPDSQQDFALAFLSILFEGAPFILLGTLISGFIDIYLPAGAMDRFLPKNKFLAVLTAGLLGAVFPVADGPKVRTEAALVT